ncbi:hypothetical protein GCM10010329_16810 [Streptomyces spiroverticillatus]|uniref:Uncharacterized protein n=1 Tax=Streptomyces finlayi TaxID=67296 RepID=A0A918WTL7_9ACTN|nr:hypothetical protein [Streptomyces finlayi]GGZ96245.1 hypothetical protein GCM10010329_16810 [Streptomyces spiroverticillatus]GHC81730.1 hypothetical protein GCM10010334_09290 [Streptomyces finlayi]
MTEVLFLPPQLVSSSVPSSFEGLVLKSERVERVGDHRWSAWVGADQLVEWEWEGGRRGFLGESDANVELTELLWQRPYDFGVVGSVVLAAQEVRVLPGGLRGSGTVQVEQPEVLDGVQRLGVLRQAVAEGLPGEWLKRALLRVELVTGPVVETVRGELDAEDRRRNPATAQDELVRDPNVLRLMRQFREDGVRFAVRRGEVREPYAGERCMTVEEATSALACLAPGSRLEVAHAADGAAGRERLWSDRGGESYRTVFNENTEAVGVLRAVEIARCVRGVVARMGRGKRYGHAHLWRDVPQLAVWAVGRQLPLVELHREGRGPGAVDWDLLVRERLELLTVGVAEGLREAYERLRPTAGGKRLRHAEVRELGFWAELMEEYGAAGDAAALDSLGSG